GFIHTKISFDILSVSVVHNSFVFTGCSDTEKEELYGTDGEEVFHSDFIGKKGLLTLPDFADFVNSTSYDGFYEQSVGSLEVCRNYLDIQIKAYKPPHTSIYSKYDVMVGVENDLICHMTGFFPPPVIISWTKNSVNVTEFMNSQYRPNHDGTFNIFSHLKITPEEGDIYSCTVGHKAILGQPQTKTWGESLFPPKCFFIFLGKPLGPLAGTDFGLGYGAKYISGLNLGRGIILGW
uniref:Ig-like domain-containing protein n=1 Tax=Sinocyclocheilus rhinocerous TaxID=307959 RepID=A0A673HZM0_9TELE